jgi:hypothetical protein
MERAWEKVETQIAQKQTRSQTYSQQQKKIQLHPLQQTIANSQAKYTIAVSGRRFGKTVLQIYKALERVAIGAPYNPVSPPVVVLAAPTLVMARRLLWKQLQNILRNHKAVENVSKSEFTITFKNPDPYKFYMPDLMIMGLNDGDGDRARGLRLWHFGGDEWQDWKASIFPEIIQPALSDTQGSTALFTYTPKGKVNHTYEAYQNALVADPRVWQAFKYKSVENPHLKPEDIELLRNSLSPRLFRQEMEASFETFEGQFFETLSESHIISDRDLPKDFIYRILSVDWGAVNPRALVVCAFIKDGFYHWFVVDEWRVPRTIQGQAILEDDFLYECHKLAMKWQVNRAFGDPSRPDAIKSLRVWKPKEGQVFKEPFKNYCSEVRGSVNDFIKGIDLMSSDFYHERIKIVDTLPQFFEECQSYHRKKDKYGNITEEEADNQVTHGIDCLRYAIASMPPVNRQSSFGSSRAM